MSGSPHKIPGVKANLNMEYGPDMSRVQKTRFRVVTLTVESSERNEINAWQTTEADRTRSGLLIKVL
jgi:hypothetical protein